MAKDVSNGNDIPAFDRGDLACRARKASKIESWRIAKRAVLQASEIAGLLELGLDLPTILGHLVALQELSSADLAMLREVGEREIQRLTAGEEAAVSESVVDLQVVLAPGAPDEDINSKLAARGLECFTDKRLRHDVPRTWQGKETVSSIQGIVGSRGRVFVGLPGTSNSLAHSVETLAPEECAVPSVSARPAPTSIHVVEEDDDARIAREQVTMVEDDMLVSHQHSMPPTSEDVGKSDPERESALASAGMIPTRDGSMAEKDARASEKAERYSARSNRGADDVAVSTSP